MAEPSSSVLLVDDDPQIRELVTTYLTGEGFAVTAVGDGEAMRAALARRAPDVVVLDIMLPGEDGLSLMHHLRREHDVGIIMLTAKDEPVDRVIGLEMGADDYLGKPFLLRELSARIKSVLRRRQKATQRAQQEPERGEAVFAGGWRLDRRQRELYAPDGQRVELTSGEFTLLEALVRAPNRVLSRDQLFDMTRDRDYSAYDRAIDVQIGRLRRKIEPDPARPMLIKTVRGAGYMFTSEVEWR
ncbi:MAG TPA: response regulator [Geminicoccaceae bacterium]|nr:response regulator [Geminicoccaceae bacterium]